MTDDTRSSEEKKTSETAAEALHEVGKQFQALGESLAAALRVALDTPENRQRTQDLRAGVEAMVNEVERAIEETGESAQGQKVRSQAARVAESVRDASEQTIQEVRPHLVSALRQLNDELQRLIRQMEG